MKNTTKSIRLGTKNNPVKIYVPVEFYVTCPNCEVVIDVDPLDTECECTECHNKFYIEFNLLDCGIQFTR